MSDEEQRRYDRRLYIVSLIVTVLTVALLVGGLVFYFWSDNEASKEKQYINEHASNIGVVVDKNTREWKGTNFYVVAEHTATNSAGEEITFINTYRVPWEDYVQIEVGDYVHGEYTHYVQSGSWSYVSFEKAEVKT